MVAEVFSAMIQGIEGQIVKIQVDISNGLPNFNMIGYLSNEVKESKERVRTALNNIGVLLPPKRISVNFAPADFRKCGTSFDIGVAAAILLAMDFVPETYIKDTLFVGELSLNGQICPISGVLPIVVAASKRGIKRCIVAQENVAEAAFVEQMEVVGCRNLEELFFYLKHGYIINDDSGEILENSGNISEDSGKECTIQDVKKSQEISESTRSLNLLVKDILENKKRKEDFIDKEKAVDDDSLPDLEDVNTHYDTQINLNEEARTYPANERMPFELKGQANVLKRKVEKIFHNMQKPILRGRRTGQLDAAMAYKLAMNQMDCFMKKGEVSEFDGCAYFLADNSGSMQGNRQENCCKALSKIEHAFQDVMPLKIVAFNADDCYSVRHQVLKNWSEKVSSNGSYNFLTHCYANGGNKDGYSIRVATEELLHRPERKKILIVLSDGLPSAYEKNDGEKDVNDAVRKARKAGISVISIFFGDDSERSTFVKMYEKNCIITEPEGIDAELVRLMKRFCFR